MHPLVHQSWAVFSFLLRLRRCIQRSDLLSSCRGSRAKPLWRWVSGWFRGARRAIDVVTAERWRWWCTFKGNMARWFGLGCPIFPINVEHDEHKVSEEKYTNRGINSRAYEESIPNNTHHWNNLWIKDPKLIFSDWHRFSNRSVHRSNRSLEEILAKLRSSNHPDNMGRGLEI